MYPLRLGFYPDGYPHPMLFTDMFYPTTIVPVTHNIPIYRRLYSGPEQNSPTDLSTTPKKFKKESLPCEANDQEQTEDLKCTTGKKLNFGIDNILDKTEESHSTSRGKEKHSQNSDESEADSPHSSEIHSNKSLHLPIVTTESYTTSVAEERLHPATYPYAFSHLTNTGPFSFPPPRYTSRSDYQGFQLLSPHDQRVSSQHTTPKRKRSWSRAVFSTLQRKGLEKRFEVQKYVTKPDRRQLAAMLGLTDAQVKVWFQNRRMKWRHVEEQKKKRQQDEERRKRIVAENKDIAFDLLSNEHNAYTSGIANVQENEQNNKDVQEEINVDECMDIENDEHL